MEANLVVDYIPRLRRYARVLTRNRCAIDDLVQDTLECALNKLHLWRPGSDMRAWLFSIMHSVFVNQWRVSKQRVEFGLEDLPEMAAPTTDFARIELAEVENALHSIPKEQRDVLLLVAVEELSYEETAETLAIPIGTVMSRLSRARGRLRQLVQQANPT